jgi:two-component system LytT family response regulator
MTRTAASDHLRTVIVDDEEPARAVLREYLSGIQGIDVIAECANGFDAVKVLTEQKPDLVFLDIQMPKLTGFEVLELVDDPPAVVFATAYDQYALRAFDVHAVDYLLKPFSGERVREAVARVRTRLGPRARASARAAAADARPAGTPLERILVKEGTRVHVIPADTIDYVEAQDDYIAIRASGKSHLKQQRLAQLEAQLDPGRFVRVHRSFVLNIERIARIELYAKDSRTALLKDGTKIPISRAGYEKLKGLLR